jgi:hypothetical protein
MSAGLMNRFNEFESRKGLMKIKCEHNTQARSWKVSQKSKLLKAIKAVRILKNDEMVMPVLSLTRSVF